MQKDTQGIDTIISKALKLARTPAVAALVLGGTAGTIGGGTLLDDAESQETLDRIVYLEQRVAWLIENDRKHHEILGWPQPSPGD